MPSVPGLALETLLILPFAILGLLWFYTSGNMDFGAVNRQTDILLIIGVIITSFLLLCFAYAITNF